MLTKKYLNDLEYRITGACIEVHKALGPGLVESVYHKCLIRELQLRNINFTSEQLVCVDYKGFLLDTALRADLFIEGCIVLELKAVEQLLPIHEAQLLTYMKLLYAPCGILYNFHCTNIVQHGKKSFVNEFYKLVDKT
jgi:GxxExxY protein